jgi:hypothetical protein
MNPNIASTIQLRQIRAFNEADNSQLMAEEVISLAGKLDECIARMGGSSVHTLQMAVQLLTKGKVCLQYRASKERLQLVKQSARLPRSEAIALVEKYLSSKSPRTQAANFDEPTRAIIIEQIGQNVSAA